MAKRYKDYFARNNARVGGIKTMLDPSPRVVLVPGVGLFGLGRSKKDARVAADLAEAAIATIGDAEAVGRFEPLPEADLFDVEYWSLEQAKLGGAKEPPLAGQIAVITGAAGAIGFATAKASRLLAPKWRCWMSTRPPRRPKPRRSAARQSA